MQEKYNTLTSSVNLFLHIRDNTKSINRMFIIRIRFSCRMELPLPGYTSRWICRNQSAPYPLFSRHQLHLLPNRWSPAGTMLSGYSLPHFRQEYCSCKNFFTDLTINTESVTIINAHTTGGFRNVLATSYNKPLYVWFPNNQLNLVGGTILLFRPTRHPLISHIYHFKQ